MPKKLFINIFQYLYRITTKNTILIFQLRILHKKLNKMIQYNLYSPNFKEFLSKPQNPIVRQAILNHPENLSDPKRLIKAIIDPDSEKLGITAEDFILAVYQYKVGNSSSLDYTEICKFNKSYEEIRNKYSALPTIEEFKAAIVDDYILSSLENVLSKNIIELIYKNLI